MSCSCCSKTFGSTFTDIISCNFCQHQFHYECSGIDRAAINSIKKFSNVCYFCNFCKAWIKNNEVSALFKKIDIIADRAAEFVDIKRMETDVAENRKLINEILKNFADVPVNKPQASYEQVSQTVRGSIHDVSSATFSGVVGTGQPVDSIKPAILEERKYLYVSRIHPTVSPDSIRDYICGKLVGSSKDDVDCKLLLSKDRVIDNTLTFISYKIGLKVADFNILNNSDMWPPGVIIREFINQPRKSKNGIGVTLQQQPV